MDLISLNELFSLDILLINICLFTVETSPMSSPLQSWWFFVCAAQFVSCLVFSVKLVLRKMRSCMIVSMEKMKVGKFMKT